MQEEKALYRIEKEYFKKVYMKKLIKIYKKGLSNIEF